MLQLCPLVPDTLNFCKLGLVPNDIGLQGAVPDVLDCIADEVHRWKLGFQHTHGLIGEYVDGLHPCVWRCVQLAPVVTVPTVTLARKVGPGLQDLQTRARRILAERNAEKAEENMWIGRMVVAESIEELDGLIKSRAA